MVIFSWNKYTFVFLAAFVFCIGLMIAPTSTSSSEAFSEKNITFAYDKETDRRNYVSVNEPFPIPVKKDAPLFDFPLSYNDITNNRLIELEVTLHDDFSTQQIKRFYTVNELGDRIILTLQPNLQKKAENILRRYRVPWGALVAIEPKTGKVLTLASYSKRQPRGKPVAIRSSFPAASLFKLITSAAVIEKAGVSPDSLVYYRGGVYLLSKHNYYPDRRRDRRAMSFRKALGKSCNPVFARLVLNNDIKGEILEYYAHKFGFNMVLPFEIPLDKSVFSFPITNYEVARTAAGFGEVLISPLHAALITAAIANQGNMMRPYIIDRIYSKNDQVLYQGKSLLLTNPIREKTSMQILDMMKETIESGTARKYFQKLKHLGYHNIAAKTGTLNGKNPKGRYYWFVAAVPADDPEIAIASLVIDPGNARIRGSALGKQFLEYYFLEYKT